MRRFSLRNQASRTFALCSLGASAPLSLAPSLSHILRPGCLARNGGIFLFPVFALCFSIVLFCLCLRVVLLCLCRAGTLVRPVSSLAARLHSAIPSAYFASRLSCRKRRQLSLSRFYIVLFCALFCLCFASCFCVCVGAGL